jgi:hypothetical protein
VLPRQRIMLSDHLLLHPQIAVEDQRCGNAGAGLDPEEDLALSTYWPLTCNVAALREGSSDVKHILHVLGLAPPAVAQALPRHHTPGASTSGTSQAYTSLESTRRRELGTQALDERLAAVRGTHWASGGAAGRSGILPRPGNAAALRDSEHHDLPADTP